MHSLVLQSEVRFVAFLPGMIYAILYFILGCAIFRAIENVSKVNVSERSFSKWTYWLTKYTILDHQVTPIENENILDSGIM